jgi:hypothetical protein
MKRNSNCAQIIKLLQYLHLRSSLGVMLKTLLVKYIAALDA